MIGSRFDRLFVLSLDSIKNWKKYWLCKCDCGAEKVIRQDHLRSKKIGSCGCKRVDISKAKATTHGMRGTRIYSIWCNMLTRCYVKSKPDYERYGGRGISVCDRWKESFENFYSDMGDAPPPLSIDRINNDGNYEPGNCKWSTPKEQANNRRKPKPRLFTASPNER